MQPETNSDKNVGKELFDDGKSVGRSAIDRLHSEVDSRKAGGISHVQAASSALQQTAGNLNDDAPAWLKSALDQGAQQIQKFAGALEQKDSRQIVQDVSAFARQSPVAFLGACAAAGFAASRLFKLSAEPAGQTDQMKTETGIGISDPDQFAAPAMAGATGGGL